MKKLDLKKELAQLPKADLIELLCGLAMASFKSSYSRADVVKDALTDYAFKRSKENAGNWALWEEYERLQAIDVKDIEAQLVAFYTTAENKRDQRERATLAEIRRKFAA